mmetsp:Transcript_98154/g.316558  ORF Transcript_98154/g.316558 Transcript_98154/m.316558 type:complete len:215 (-) Transcript_98154:450-1094(-)
MGSPRVSNAASTDHAPAAWAFRAAAPSLQGNCARIPGSSRNNNSATSGNCSFTARSSKGTDGCGVAACSSKVLAIGRWPSFSAVRAAPAVAGTPAARSFSTTPGLPMPAAASRALEAEPASSVSGPSSRAPAQRSSTSSASTPALTARTRTSPATSLRALRAEMGTTLNTWRTALPGRCQAAAGTSCTREAGRGTTSTTSATFSCLKRAEAGRW